MFELLSICFVSLPLANEPRTEILLNLGSHGENLIAFTRADAMPQECRIYTPGGKFVIDWPCDRVFDRIKAECR